MFKTDSIDDGPDFSSLVGPVFSQMIYRRKLHTTKDNMSLMKKKFESVLYLYDNVVMIRAKNQAYIYASILLIRARPKLLNDGNMTIFAANIIAKSILHSSWDTRSREWVYLVISIRLLAARIVIGYTYLWEQNESGAGS